LYNWYAVNDSRGLAPEGFHVPSENEWATLIDFLGGENVAGGKLKEKGTMHWDDPNQDANNSSGFIGLPGGGRNKDGKFLEIGGVGSWWCSDEFDSSNAKHCVLVWFFGNAPLMNYSKNDAVSVRCIRD